jgi:hypothetical protein
MGRMWLSMAIVEKENNATDVVTKSVAAALLSVTTPTAGIGLNSNSKSQIWPSTAVASAIPLEY